MSSQNFVGWVGTLNTAGRFVINGARTAPHPKIAMDNSNGPYRGRLYLVYATNDPPGNGNKPDVWLRYSTNQGANWSAAARINDNPNPTASDQWFPEISCERETGRLYIHWYDDRNNPAGYGVDVYATYTEDGGQTFKPNQRLTNVTFSYPNPPCSPNTNCYRGDYTSITGNKDVAFSIWGDHRNGNALNMGSFFRLLL
ncbi:MAG: exo-alpha-sialidase [Ignavibacteria bacterium]|nr:exo-alpha-sialidase [Ignavibacteria bacterium]